MAVDLSKLPPVLPVDVRRVDKEGFPSEWLLDWEGLQNGFFRRTVVDLDTRVTTVTSTAHDNSADITTLFSTKTTADDAAAIAQTAISAKVTDGTLATSASVSQTLLSYATKIQADAIADTKVQTYILNGTLYNASTVDFKLSSKVTATEARAEATTVVNASLANGTLQAGLSVQQLASISAVDGLKVRFSVVGTLNNSTGGFTFQGVQRADGTGAVFTTEFFSNVVIHGSLIVDGTVSNSEITDNAVSNHAEATALLASGSTASVAITVRANARVSVDATLQIYDTSSLTGPSTVVAAAGRAHLIYVDGAWTDTVYEYDRIVQAGYVNNVGPVSVYNFASLAGGTGYTGFFGPLAAGTHIFGIQNMSSGNMRAIIRATELSK